MTDVRERRRHLVETRDWDTPVVGLMLRHDWVDELCERASDVPFAFLEVYPENYMRRGRRHLGGLDRLGQHFPFTSHGVHLSLAGTDPLGEDYLTELEDFLARYDIPWFSDHIGASVHGGEILHEILPIPFRRSGAKRVGDRASEAQERAKRPLLLENAATYFVPRGSDMSEIEFVNAILEQTEASFLFDVNNVFVNAMNLGFSIDDYLDGIPFDRVKELHIGGFTTDRALGLLIDSHAAAPSPPVYEILKKTLRRTGPIPILLEWESHWKSLDEQIGQAERIAQAYREVAAEHA